MLTKRVSKNRDGDIQLVIRVTGAQDVYRFASHMLTGQCEFADAGVRALRSLRRRIEPHQWNWMLGSLGGPATTRFQQARQRKQEAEGGDDGGE